jgi:hypothetical protein
MSNFEPLASSTERLDTRRIVPIALYRGPPIADRRSWTITAAEIDDFVESSRTSERDGKRVFTLYKPPYVHVPTRLVGNSTSDGDNLEHAAKPKISSRC